MKKNFLFALVLFLTFSAISQPPSSIPGVPKPPQPAIPKSFGTPNATIGFPNPNPQPRIPTMPYMSNNYQRGQQMVQRDMQMMQQRQQQGQQLIDEAYREFAPKTVYYNFPSLSHVKGTEHYCNALDEISQMLEGKQKLNLSKAVFLTENAFFNNKSNFQWFDADIEGYVEIIRQAIEQEGFDYNNPSTRKWGIQQFLADTIQLKDDRGNVMFTHLPYQYDFKDPWGKTDWSKQFVMKLLNTGKGQCHSMPLLYLMLAEKMGVEAWLSYSPKHTYIKVQDEKGNMLNYETTNGHYTTDNWVLSSGFIKSEALRNGIYLDTMNRKEVIATCLADLANGYSRKYGFDPFVLDCVNTALAYSPNNIYALQIKSNYRTALFFFVIKQLGVKSPKDLPNYPKAYELFKQMHEIYGEIDAIGFEDMPEEMYQNWLKSFETEGGKQPVQIIRP